MIHFPKCECRHVQRMDYRILSADDIVTKYFLQRDGQSTTKPGYRSITVGISGLGGQN